MHRLFFSLFLTTSSAVLALFIGGVQVLGLLAESFPDVLRNPKASAFALWSKPFWDAMLWLSNHMEVVGVAIVAAFLLAISMAVALAHKCVPSQSQIDADNKSRLNESLLSYVQRGEYIVRFE